MQPLSRSELNRTDRELLEAILVKGPTSLSKEEKDILCARRQYLSFAERQAYGDIIPDDVQEAIDQQNVSQGPTQYSKPPNEEEKIADALGKAVDPNDEKLVIPPANATREDVSEEIHPPVADANPATASVDPNEGNTYAPDPSQTNNT